MTDELQKEWDAFVASGGLERRMGGRLTPEDVIEIRRALEAGEMTQAALARKYRVTKNAIAHVKFGRTWQDV